MKEIFSQKLLILVFEVVSFVIALFFPILEHCEIRWLDFKIYYQSIIFGNADCHDYRYQRIILGSNLFSHDLGVLRNFTMRRFLFHAHFATITSILCFYDGQADQRKTFYQTRNNFIPVYPALFRSRRFCHHQYRFQFKIGQSVGHNFSMCFDDIYIRHCVSFTFGLAHGDPGSFIWRM